MARKSYKVTTPTETQEQITQEIPILEAESPIIEETPVIEEQIIQPIYKVKVNHPNLRRRSGPSFSADILGYITDYATFDVFEEQNGWGRVGDNEWIKLEFTKKI